MFCHFAEKKYPLLVLVLGVSIVTLASVGAGVAAGDNLFLRFSADARSGDFPGGNEPTRHEPASYCYLCPAEEDPARQPSLELAKSTDPTRASAGAIISYTVQSQISLSGAHSFTATLTDRVPAGLAVLTKTISVDGDAAPHLYDPLDHLIRLNAAGKFTEGITLTLTYAVQVNNGMVSGTVLANVAELVAALDGGPPAGPVVASVVIIVVNPPPVYLPVMLQTPQVSENLQGHPNLPISQSLDP